MKKIILFVILSVAISSQAFSFQKRFFEVHYEMPFSVSNSTFFLADIFTKEFVIDLPALSKTVPNAGLSVNFFSKPALRMKLDLRDFLIAVNYGIDFQSTSSISKNFFKFFSDGIELNEEINIHTAFNTDAFFFIDTTIGFDVGKVKLQIEPGFFFPMVHSEIGNSDISITNTENGSLVMKMDGGVNIYSQFDLSVLEDIQNVSFRNFDYLSFLSTFGLDVAGRFEYPFREGFTLIGYTRIPFIPGRLDNRITADLNFSADINLLKMVSDDEGFVYDYGLTNFRNTYGSKKVNRPLKMMAGINWDGFRKWLNVCAQLGFGVRYPFTKEAIFYPEYILGVDLSLMNIIGVSVRSQYCDFVFSNRVEFFVDARVFELDLGISIDSTSFVGSFKIAGVGAHLGISVGF